MRLIVAGCRDIQFPRADELVQDAFSSLNCKNQVVEVIHGAAKGIDSAAGRYFSGWMKVTTMPADWAKHGKAAGPIRNRQMAEQADALLAIWDGKSRGTRDMIEAARGLGLRVYVHQFVNLPPAEIEDYEERAAVMWYEARDCYATEETAEKEALRVVLAKRRRKQ